MYFYRENLHMRRDSLIYLTYFHMGIALNIFHVATVIVLQLNQSAAEPELKYQRIMHRVKEYMRDKKLPENLRNKLKIYYEYRFQGSYFKENAICGTLSSHLNQEIMVHSSRALIETSTILHALPRNVLSNLMGVLKPVIYLSEDVIYKSETLADCMFFVVSGTVALITFNGKEICHEKDGGYFGEAALIYPDKRRLESVITLEVCELLRLNRRDFKRMFTHKCTFYERLERAAEIRRDQINKLTIAVIEAEMTQMYNTETDVEDENGKDYERERTDKETDHEKSEENDEDAEPSDDAAAAEEKNDFEGNDEGRKEDGENGEG
ncbi:uncharacterized protein LOC108627609 [Ceratina calcarata]|uniref:Uncharacterized protein LOC108627609 n=1 Tax=Ceratina calcarata TaxID=156304 RepID=A0AAJ7WCU7_9HYME|nr:uncharacterized protein LOC108627609 [Ceratina calcarata]